MRARVSTKAKLVRRAIVGAVALALLAAGWFGRGFYDDDATRAETRRVADAARSPSAQFEIELWARSPEHLAASTLCLLDGEYGMIVQDGHVSNRNSHVDFDHYSPGCFTAGIQGGDQGQVIDLGDAADLAASVNGAPLDVLRWRDGSVVAEGDEFLVPDPVGQPDGLEKVRRWLATVLKVPAIASGSSPLKSAQVKPGHVYFVRVAAVRAPTEIVALLLVTDYVAGKRVKLRCVQL